MWTRLRGITADLACAGACLLVQTTPAICAPDSPASSSVGAAAKAPGPAAAASPSAATAEAKPATAEKGAPSPTAPAPPKTATPSAKSLLDKARQIRELAAGKLDPALDARQLLRFSPNETLGDPELSLQALIERVERLSRRALAMRRLAFGAKQPTSDDPREAARDLFEMRAAFLALPAKDRAALLEQHEARRREAEAKERARDRAKQRLEALKNQAQTLQAFLDNKLDPEVDPKPLLTIDLSDDSELGASAPRSQRFLALSDQKAEPEPAGAQPQPAGAAAPKESAPQREPSPPAVEKESAPNLDQQLAAAEEHVDRLRLRLLAMPREALDQLLEAHRKRGEQSDAAPEVDETTKIRIGEAEQAAQRATEERKKALEALKRARTEARRALAERRAQLLGTKEAQARLGVRIAERRARVDKYAETSLGWSRRVRELEGRSVLDSSRQADAGRLYDELVGELTTFRSRLREILHEIQSGNLTVPRPAAAQKLLRDQADSRELSRLEADLQRAADKLESQLTELRWDLASVLRDSVVTMNQARLGLMPLLSPERRSALRGFGSQGVRQAGRELSQIVLEGRYHLLALPRHLNGKGRELRTSPLPVLFSLLKVVVILGIFRWWRRRADRFLEGIQKSWLSRRPQTAWTRAVSGLAWYARQVRHPLEWLLLVGALVNAVASVGEFPELEYVRIVVMWTLLGSFVVRLLHAIAGRQSEAVHQAAELRFRSLQLVGVSVVIVGLILSLAQASVGRGAIYQWVMSTCWVLGVPVLLLLTVWWRPVVIQRAKQAQQPTGVLAWVSAHDRGVASLLASAAGGAVLLGQGLHRFALRQASHLAITRRFLAYLFRREVERQASIAPNGIELGPLPQSIYDALDPEAPSSALVTEVERGDVERLRALVRAQNNSVTVVTGERGAGKTTVLRRVLDGLSPSELCQLDCETGHFDELLAGMARAAGLPDTAEESTVAAALRDQNYTVVCIDNAQRLVRPIIGGLADMDRLISFAHRVGGATSWVVAVGAPAWQYLRRARGDRATFDEVITLEPWDEGQIAQLVRLRCRELSVVPSFESLVVPRQLDAGQLNDAERTERDYYRILWNASEGNPAVALHLWRKSLFSSPGRSELVVRLFKTPGVAQLEDLPSTMYFVLRAIVQLERAIEPDIVLATGLRPADVTDALRSSRARGMVETVDHRLRISIGWYRPVTQVLRRQHLLIM